MKLFVCSYLKVVGNISTITASILLIVTLPAPTKMDAKISVTTVDLEKYSAIADTPEVTLIKTEKIPLNHSSSSTKVEDSEDNKAKTHSPAEQQILLPNSRFFPTLLIIPVATI